MVLFSRITTEDLFKERRPKSTREECFRMASVISMTYKVRSPAENGECRRMEESEKIQNNCSRE